MANDRSEAAPQSAAPPRKPFYDELAERILEFGTDQLLLTPELLGVCVIPIWRFEQAELPVLFSVGPPVPENSQNRPNIELQARTAMQLAEALRIASETIAASLRDTDRIMERLAVQLRERLTELQAREEPPAGA